MMKRTHMFAGDAAVINFISINNILFFPIAVLGAIIPDWDYKIGLKHRGITHTAVALIITTSLFSMFNLL